MVSHATAGRVSWQRLPPPGGRWQSSGLHGSRCCLVPLEGGGESVSTMTAGPRHAQCMVFAAERTAAIGGHRFSREGGGVRKILRQRRLPRATRRVAKRRPSLQQLLVVHHGATVSTTTAGPASRLLESGGLPGRALVFPCNNGSGIAPQRERQRAVLFMTAGAALCQLVGWWLTGLLRQAVSASGGGIQWSYGSRGCLAPPGGRRSIELYYESSNTSRHGAAWTVATLAGCYGSRDFPRVRTSDYEDKGARMRRVDSVGSRGP